MNKFRKSVIACVMAISLMLVGCSGDLFKTTSPERLQQLLAEARAKQTRVYPESVREEKIEEGYDRDYLGYLPEYYYGDLTESEKKGLQTWYFWTGGNEKYFRDITKYRHGEGDLFGLLDARPDSERLPGDNEHHYQRSERFEAVGAINDPGCTAAKGPDEYGLWFDICDKDPHATGIMGMRKFSNPDFDPEQWDVAKYYQAGIEKARVEPPYRIGISCGICHIAFHPLKPPESTDKVKWENLVPALGNQYLREVALYGVGVGKDDFRRQVLEHQQPGTSDTSRFGTDRIDNPNTINAIFNLKYRPTHEQVMNDGTKKEVHNILKDGADSVGLDLASERVYINIGSCSDYWTTLHDPLEGKTPQKPFDIETARKECPFWSKTEARVEDAGNFLMSIKPFYLKDAPGGEAYSSKDESVLKRGKIAFAENCASCHSSKQPPSEIASDPEKAKQWYRDSVLSPDFLENNFLSNDKRYPVTLIGTNAARSLATNAKQGHIWEQFSSKTYKELPSPGTITLENPFEKDRPIEFEVPSGGTGYYRTPSLVSLWTSAPLFHNNALGTYTQDLSVEGRMKAFDDAIHKLLWPETRDNWIERTDRETTLELGNLKVKVPKGTPIKLLANLDPRNMPTFLKRKLDSPLGSQILQTLADLVQGAPLSDEKRALLHQKIATLLLKSNQAPDFIEDRGHYFGSNLADEDKQALIEFLKTF